MFRVTKVLLQPTVGQQRALAELLAVQCEVYNAALEERRGAWRREHRAVTRFEQYRQIAGLRVARRDVARFGGNVVRGTLTRVDRAYSGFFARVRRGERPGYPRFRSRRRFDSADWPDTSGWRLDDRLYVQGVGHMRFRTSRRGVRGVAKTLTIKREANRWFAAIACELDAPEPLAATGRAVGVDLGVAAVVTTSEGERFANPRYLAASAERLAAAACVSTGSSRRCSRPGKCWRSHAAPACGPRRLQVSLTR